MLKNSEIPVFSHPWLPAGLMGIDLAALSLEEGLGNVRPPNSRGAGAQQETQIRAGAWEEEVQRISEERCGLRRYAELGLAVQPVRGVMCAGASRLSECYGMFNTERIARVCRTVAADAQIRALVLEFDSPGGYVSGVEEAAAAVQSLPAMRKGLAVIGYTARLCASAAAWLSAACEQHFAAPSATLGSIGIINSITDSSRAWKDEGLDRTVFTDGKYKALGMPGVPVTEEHKAHLAAGVAESSAAFKGYLRARRPGISDEAMQGQTFQARRAPAGFCDGTQFSDLEELLAVIGAGRV